jgi:hypothetical protein
MRDRKATGACQACGTPIRPGRINCKRCDTAKRIAEAEAQRCEICGERAKKNRTTGALLCHKHYRRAIPKRRCRLCDATVSRPDDTLCRAHLLAQRPRCELCDRPVSARGLCNTHYSRWRYLHKPDARAMALKYLNARLARDPEYQSRIVERMPDCYIRHVYFLPKNTPRELLEAYRGLLQCKRQLRRF